MDGSCHVMGIFMNLFAMLTNTYTIVKVNHKD